MSPKFQRGPSDSHQMDGYHVHSRWSELLHGTRDAAESTKAVYRPHLAPRKKNTQVQVSQWRRRGVRKRQRSVHHQAESRPLRSVSANPNSRQQCSLTWEVSLAGWPPSKSVDLLPFERLCSSSVAMLGISAASRKTSGPAVHEARTLLGANAGNSRTRLPVKPTRAVPPKGGVPPRQPLDLAEVLVKLAAVLDKPRSSRSLTRGRVRSGSRCGTNGDGIHRCSHRRRIRRRRGQ